MSNAEVKSEMFVSKPFRVTANHLMVLCSRLSTTPNACKLQQACAWSPTPCEKEASRLRRPLAGLSLRHAERLMGGADAALLLKAGGADR